MNDYLVRWQVEIPADSPTEAVEIARSYQLDPQSTALIFEVKEPVKGWTELVIPAPRGITTNVEHQLLFQHEDLVLCKLPHNQTTPFVVWRLIHSNSAAYAGSYCKTLSEALQVLSERL